MSINHRHAIDEKTTKRFGKLFHSIDFELSDNLTNEQAKNEPYQVTVGKFMIGHKSFDVTLKELRYIMETAHAAQESYFKAYRLGLLK